MYCDFGVLKIRKMDDIGVLKMRKMDDLGY